MKVKSKRWGECLIRKQSHQGKKNQFDKSRSFSIDPQGNNYTLNEYFIILQSVTNLTETLSFTELKKRLDSLTEIKPGYIKKIKEIEKEKHSKFENIDDLKQQIKK